ncbi:hypothetical protein PY092_16245 [Muricauda sp. 334s03]|uniref:Uncharacterized protein n=2 Tax=Flagellimonas yonaguniensis TaxID=3031325 RepID=A0ABT5Y2V5_9FLAO|nr:hypothetical protein [[Muricauda] yonaguniensis]
MHIMKAPRLFFFTFLTFIMVICGAYTAKYSENTQGYQKSKEEWFFKAISRYPVSITFEPIVLFDNGDYVEVGTEPVGSLDRVPSKSNRPKAWGKWELKGGRYYLTDHKGRTNDYGLGSGNWFPAFPYRPNPKLARIYQNTCSTDIGYGSTLTISKVTFIDGEHFIEGENMGGLTPNAATWEKSAHTGTYHIEDHIITLNFSDGKQEKRSFAVSPKGNPAIPNPKMIFIGGDAYLAEE